MKCDIKKSLRLFSLILISLNVNGNRRLFVLDTGSQGNCLCDDDTESMKLFKATRDKTMSRGLNGHAAESDNGTLTYQIGKHTCTSEFCVISGKTFDVFTQETGIHVSGLLGIPFIMQHNCIIDIVEGKLTVNIDDALEKEDTQAA